MVTTKSALRGKTIATMVAIAVIIAGTVVGLNAAGVFSKKITIKRDKITPTVASCVADSDCKNTICPQVVGSDYPTCDLVKKTCYCGQMPDSPAYFKFEVAGRTETFIFKLNDQSKIKLARDVLSGVEKQRTNVMGNIIKNLADYNQPWSFILESESIEFFSEAIELCDANITYVEENFSEFCAGRSPNCQWCPWGSHLISEVYP